LKTESGRKRAALLALASMVVAACGGGDGGGPAAVPVVPSVVSGVSGMFSQGGSITITGSAFGSNADGGPMLYDNFDNATGDIVTSAGAGKEPQIHAGALSSYTAWVRDGGGDYTSRAITRDNDSLKAGSTWHARMNFDSNLGNFWGLNLHVPHQVGTGDELYVTFYFRFTKTHANYGRQIKSMVWYSGGSNDQGYFNAALGTCQANDVWRGELLDVAYTGSTGVSAQAINGQWVRQELYFKQGAPSTSNGYLYGAIFSPTGTPSFNPSASGNIVTRTDSLVWSDWYFGGGYYDDCNDADFPAFPGEETATIDVDEFYMDDTLAHVEVCDSPTWAGRTKCELQVPTAWSDTSITATFNIGYLSSGNAYVYVINAGGGVNAQGFEIVIP
jgi:hypothetical protein